ncbi:MAG: efflux RND transporter periplasmic adaptor subunit [Gemmatimonadota bacterium]|nr:efflux RND transporter periplasmic adaptor subunit [Gemmatimonadota bacterium]
MIRAPILPALLALLFACGRTGADGPTFPGTVELDESDHAPLVGGRIVEVRVTEGDTVTTGDTLALLVRAGLPEAVEQRVAQLSSMRARLADLRRGSREAEIARAQADADAAEAEVARTARDLTRVQEMAKDGAVSPQELDAATTAAATAARRRDAARATLELAREGTREDQIRAAEADVRTAEAQLRSARADIGELAVIAAVDGVVLSKNADPGEVVPAGTTIVTVGIVGRRWVRVYLPARLLDTLQTGAPASILVAGDAGAAPVHGRLGAVNAKAEFTPRAALTEEERADLLFASRVELVDPPATLRPGLPVTVRF